VAYGYSVGSRSNRTGKSSRSPSRMLNCEGLDTEAGQSLRNADPLEHLEGSSVPDRRARGIRPCRLPIDHRDVMAMPGQRGRNRQPHRPRAHHQHLGPTRKLTHHDLLRRRAKHCWPTLVGADSRGSLFRFCGVEVRFSDRARRAVRHSAIGSSECRCSGARSSSTRSRPQPVERPGGSTRQLPHAPLRARGARREDTRVAQPGQQPHRGGGRAFAGKLGEDAGRSEAGRRRKLGDVARPTRVRADSPQQRMLARLASRLRDRKLGPTG
jgi:hypothetical protein